MPDMKNISAVGASVLAATLLLGAIAAGAAAQTPAAKTAPAPAAKTKAKAKEAYPGEKLASQAQISMDAAQASALALRPGGQIVSRELEKEAGGSGLRYTFDIKLGGKTYEVGIDARDGKVLENGAEGPEPKAAPKAKAKG